MKNTLPVLLLKNLILLPNQEVKLELTNDLSCDVIKLSTEVYHNELIVLISDLQKIAIVAKVKHKIILPNGNLRVTLRGLFRAEVLSLSNNNSKEEILECNFLKMTIPKYDEIEATAVKRKLEELIQKYVNSDGISNSILNLIKDVKDLNKVTDLIANFLPISFINKLDYIDEINPVLRGYKLIHELHLELEVIRLDKKIEENLQNSLEESQKEFILKEKIREIEEELGEASSKEKEVRYYTEKLALLDINNPKIIKKIETEIKKLKLMSDISPEIANIRNYLDWVISLPWNKYSKDETNLETIKKNLDKTHFGMNEAKDKILEYIAAKNRNKNIDSLILCLVGPSGVGKTTFAKSIADSLNKEFYKISVGGLNDSSILNGHRRTYLGSNPGKIIEGLKKCGTKNPVILIDEVDKMVKDYKGDPASCLLDILDKSQNKTFIDNYLEEEFDLSQILFILTANYEEEIPYELYDRLEVIELSSYTLFEKIEIAKKYLIPNIYHEHNLNLKDIKINEQVLKEIIENYTNEAGIRELKRILTTIIRKMIVLNKIENEKITPNLLHELLGIGKYAKNEYLVSNNFGVVNALGVNATGGVVMPIETCFYNGNGKIKITGLIKQLTEESINVAISYIMANKEIFNIPNYDFLNINVHIHMLDASVKKDGCSAGITITTALLSLALKKVIPSNIAMTGEITLNGIVRKIGGLKEKLIGAYNLGIKKVFIPKDNHNDLEDIPSEVLNNIDIIEINNYIEIYNFIFKEK